MAASMRRWPKGYYAKRGLDVTIREGGPAGECAAISGGRRGRFRHRLQQLHLAQSGEAEGAAPRGDGDFPERPASPDQPSPPRSELAGRNARPSDHDFRCGDDQLLALAEGALAFPATARSANTPSTWRLSWSIPTPSRKAISPASPSPSRTRPISSPRCFLLADYGYPGYANMVLVPQKWIDTNPQGGAGLL